MKRIHFGLLSVYISGCCLLFTPSLSQAEERSYVVSDSLDYMEAASEPQDDSTAMGEIVPVSEPPQEGELALEEPVSVYHKRIKDAPESRQRLKHRDSKPAIINKALDDWDFSMQAGAGLRRDEFRWTIAGDVNGENPNILRELIWKNLSIYEIGTKARATWMDKIRLEGSWEYGWINDGDNQDSDYSGDNRQGEYSRSNNRSPGNNTMDASAGVGYQFNIPVAEEWKDFLTDELKFVMLGGYSRREINLQITEGSQTIAATGPFEGLDSTYQAVWRGPWVGGELAGERKNFKGYTRVEYHWADYQGAGNWNLRDDFQHPTSFTHDATGHGLTLAFGGELEFSENWDFGLGIKYQDWSTDAGIDRKYFSDGTTADTQFNEAKWRSLGGMVTSAYHFSLGKPQPQENYAELK